MCGAGRPPADGSAEIDGATAALGRKDGSGIYFPPNPPARITSIRIKAGVGTSLQRWGWILQVGQLSATGLVEINGISKIHGEGLAG